MWKIVSKFIKEGNLHFLTTYLKDEIRISHYSTIALIKTTIKGR